MRRLILLAMMALTACTVLYPQQISRLSLLEPATGDSLWQQDGLRITAEYLSDAELNELFPQESSLGEYSINPYTFGNHVDADVGYVRNRFTVFRVRVDNQSYAKVEIDPLRALLHTDRSGEMLQSYGILAGSAPRSMESYYRARRGPSGNEFYRFNVRMGIVLSNNYSVDEKVFKGETYSGLIVFDPLHEDVGSVQLVLRDVALRFGAFGEPLETVDLRFDFQRRIVESTSARVAHEAPVSLARLSRPAEVSSNAVGDSTREARTIERIARSRLTRANECFQGPFVDGRAAEGEVTLAFSIDGSGATNDVRVVVSEVWDDAVGACLQQDIAGWVFSPSAREGAGAAQYSVQVKLEYEFVDVRP